MLLRTITLKHVTAGTTDDVPPVEGWAPGLGNVPLDVRMAGLKSQLADLGLVYAPPQQRLRTGLLRVAWGGFPRHALVISGIPGGDGWLAVSNEPALGSD